MKVKSSIIILLFPILNLLLPSQSGEELILRGDELYLQMENLETALAAKEKYMEALSKEGDKYEVYWRLARILYFIGAHTEDKEEKKAIFSQGIYYAKKAVELNPEKPDGHYWFGVCNGVYGETRGVLKSLSLVKPIREAMEKVIEIDRSYEDGGADRVLGRMFFKLPGFVGGSKEKSLQHLLKSKELGPDDPLTRIYLADTYLALNKVDKAREELEYVLNMKPDPRWVIGVNEYKEEAREMLKRKEFKKKS